MRSRDSSVGIVTRLGPRRSGVRILTGATRFLFYTQRRDRLRGPVSFQFSGYRGSLSGMKRPGRDVDHSPVSSAQLKNVRIYTSTPPVCFDSVDRGTLFFTFFLISSICK